MVKILRSGKRVRITTLDMGIFLRDVIARSVKIYLIDPTIHIVNALKLLTKQFLRMRLESRFKSEYWKP